MANKFSGAHQNGALAFATGDDKLDLSRNPVDANSDIVITSMMFEPDTKIHDFVRQGNHTQNKRQILDTGNLQVSFFLDTQTPGVSLAKLEALRTPELNNGDGTVIIFTQFSNTLVPAVDNPIEAARFCVTPFPQGGTIGDAYTFDKTFEIDGDRATFTDLPDADATLAIDTPASPTELDLTWDADTELIPNEGGRLRVVSYDVYQSLFTFTDLADATKVNLVPVLANPLGNTFTAIGLTTATPYFFRVVAVDFYGFESLAGSEATATTT